MRRRLSQFVAVVVIAAIPALLQANNYPSAHFVCSTSSGLLAVIIGSLDYRVFLDRPVQPEEVSTIRSGEIVQYALVSNAANREDPQRVGSKPITASCNLPSGRFRLIFDAVWPVSRLNAMDGGTEWLTVTLVRDNVTLLPSTLILQCDTTVRGLSDCADRSAIAIVVKPSDPAVLYILRDVDDKYVDETRPLGSASTGEELRSGPSR